MMRISILCSSFDHPVNRWLEIWQREHAGEHEITIYRDKVNLPGGDLLFLVSCNQLVNRATRESYQQTFVLHASDLPRGRGWSPHVWELLGGAESITLSLLSAEDGVDTGAIWAKQELVVPPHALHDEINAILFSGEISLMNKAIELVSEGADPTPQNPDIEPTYYPRRTPQDSEIDPSQPLTESFNKIRLTDPDRYPAFFRLHGHTYTIELKKVSEDDNDLD